MIYHIVFYLNYYIFFTCALTLFELCDSPIASISSSVRPLDSGTNFSQIIHQYTNNTKIAKTICCEVSCHNWEQRPTKKEPIQFNDDALPEAKPLIANGNISPTITHVSGAHVKE